ncbi:hypothetical protein V8F20_001368 [Naviculisporaceae sp. PSN 640]
MQLTQAIAVLLAAIPATMAAGEKCSYYDGLRWADVNGICGSPSECVNVKNGYWVPGKCPGGDNNRCCITRKCVTTKPPGFHGDCSTVSRCAARRGKTQDELCPGLETVKCCFDARS